MSGGEKNLHGGGGGRGEGGRGTCTCTSLCLEYRVLWVRVPPEAAHFF